MQLEKEEKDLLIEMVDKHLAFVTANYKNVNCSGMNNLKKKNDLSMKMSKVRKLKEKLIDEILIKTVET